MWIPDVLSHQALTRNNVKWIERLQDVAHLLCKRGSVVEDIHDEVHVIKPHDFSYFTRYTIVMSIGRNYGTQRLQQRSDVLLSEHPADQGVSVDRVGLVKKVQTGASARHVYRTCKEWQPTILLSGHHPGRVRGMRQEQSTIPHHPDPRWPSHHTGLIFLPSKLSGSYSATREVRTSGIWKAVGDHDVRIVIEYITEDVHCPVVQEALITVIGSLGEAE